MDTGQERGQKRKASSELQRRDPAERRKITRACDSCKEYVLRQYLYSLANLVTEGSCPYQKEDTLYRDTSLSTLHKIRSLVRIHSSVYEGNAAVSITGSRFASAAVPGAPFAACRGTRIRQNVPSVLERVDRPSQFPVCGGALAEEQLAGTGSDRSGRKLSRSIVRNIILNQSL